jgi:transposase-like protein
MKLAEETLENIEADRPKPKKKNNNMVERFHNTFRERDKVMRGFKGQRNAEFHAEAFKTYYNFVKPYMALGGLTPSQVAKIQMQTERNRWMKLF